VDDLKAKIASLEAELGRVRKDAPRRLFEHISEMVVSVDGTGQIDWLNHVALSQIGGDAAAQIGCPLRTLFDDEAGRALERLCISDFVGVGDSEVRLADGRAVGFSICRFDGRASFVLLQDRSQREHLEAELRHVRRMASVGRLAAELTHDINNPLAVIQGRLEMLKALPDMPASTRARHLGIIDDHSQRVVRIIQNLQIFARPRTPVCQATPLLDQLNQAIATLGRRLERVVVDVSVSPQLMVYADPTQSALVWENLLVSAANIMPADRTLLIEATGLDGGGTRVLIQCESGAWPEEILTELRSPYSGGSHRADPGRGLALAISWGIVQDHGGWMMAQNREEQGANIELFFPGLEQTAEEGKSPSPSSGHRGWDVLVVDDDVVMADTVKWMLSTLGHRSVLVHSAEDALARLEADEFQVVLSDQRLPGMDGETMLALIHRQWHGMIGRTILTSGLLHRPEEGQIFLQKPFSRDQLSAVLSDMESDSDR
jgi:signal transduction histidine kinase/CheY-like chemotaxis protein